MIDLLVIGERPASSISICSGREHVQRHLMRKRWDNLSNDLWLPLENFVYEIIEMLNVVIIIKIFQ